jgi:hypothetical protein
MPREIPINADTVGKMHRFLREDVHNWLVQPGKKPLLQQASEAVDLWRAYRFFPYQYFKHDLYLRDIDADYRTFIPSIIADQCVVDLNRAEYAHWLEDKIEFDTRMRAAELPVVNTFAILSLKDGVVSARDRDDRALSLQQLWELAKQHTSRAVFMKPRLGGQGIGAHRLGMGEQGFERDGEAVTEDSMRTLLERYEFEDYLVQPYFEQHETLDALNSRSVNTLRVVTLLTDGKFELVGALLRVGSGQTETDNWSGGGYIANVDLTTGAVAPVAKVKLSYATQRRVERHPVSQIEFGSVRIAFAPEILALVERGARTFAPIRLIGWDIAIGKDAPCVIEANFLGQFLMLQDACGGLRHSGVGRELAARFNWR